MKRLLFSFELETVRELVDALRPIVKDPAEEPPIESAEPDGTVEPSRLKIAFDILESSLINTIKRMAEGIVEPHSRLSERELQVFIRIAQGHSPAKMASELGLSVKTVSTYRARIMEKMGMRANAEIATYAVKKGMVL